MKIVVDENMPHATKLFSAFGEVISVPGRPFDKSVLKDADALMVRSVTKVDQDLLNASPVQFVGTATAGTDHLDQTYLNATGITTTSAAGCNAIAVVEYVFSCLLYFASKNQFELTDKTVGIIGVGHVGSILAQRLAVLGIKVLLCDPPRARLEPDNTFYAFEYLIEHADIITFHTPLIQGGIDNTYHLFDHLLMSEFADDKIIINASRGEVIDNTALLRALQQGRRWHIALDVFENEPYLNLSLLDYIDIATQHIAGHSLEGKIRGTTLLVEKLHKHLATTTPDSIKNIQFNDSETLLQSLLPTPAIRQITLDVPFNQSLLKKLVNLAYDVKEDDLKFRQAMDTQSTSLSSIDVGKIFDHLRKHYPMRREWSALTVIVKDVETAQLLNNLGFQAQIATS